MGRSATAATGRGLSFIGDKAKYAAIGLTGIGVVSARAGLQFNASMEQNEIAFTHFLGSAERARREIGFLYRLAKVTPFQFNELTLSTRKFLAFGFSVKEANALLKTMADTASGLALDEGGIDRMVLAIGQIRSKGTLQMEDLRQLQELGAVNMPKLRKQLGLTADEMADIGAQGIGSKKALRVLKTQWDDTFGGMSAKQAKSFTGQLSTLRDNANQTFGTITMPAFERLRDDVFPDLNRSAERLSDVFARDDLTLGQKLSITNLEAKRFFRPLVDEGAQAVRDMRLGEKAIDEFEQQMPRLAEAAANAAPDVAKAFFNAFMDAGPWGKLFMGLATAGKLSGAAGGMWGIRGPMGAGSAANPIAVIGGGTPGLAPAGAPGWGKAGRLARLGGGVAGTAVGGALALRELRSVVNDAESVYNRMESEGAASILGKVGRAGTWAGKNLPVFAGRSLNDLQHRNRAERAAAAALRSARGAGRAAGPVRRREVIEVHTQLNVAEQVLAKVVRRVEADRRARR